MTEKAITPYQKLKNTLRMPSVQQQFEDVLGKKAPGFVASMLSVASQNKMLSEADPNTVIVSAMKAATLDLPISPELGFAYVVPYKNKGNTEAQFQLGYKGMVQLALRTGKYQTLNVAPIHADQTVTVNQITGEVQISGPQTGEVAGWVGYFRLTNGFEKFLYMSKQEIHDHAKKYSKSYGNQYGPWQQATEAMERKTVLRRLLSTYGLMSIEMQGADVDESAPAQAQAVEYEDDNVIEGEFSEPDYQPIVHKIVEKGYAPDPAEAVGMLLVSPFDPDHPDLVEKDVLAWAKDCRAKMDQGLMLSAAAEKATQYHEKKLADQPGLL